MEVQLLNKNVGRCLTVFAWFVLYGSIVVAYSSLNETNNYIFINADTLGFSTIYFDVFENDGNIESWFLPSSPSLFPDVILYFSLFFLLKLNVLTTSFIYGLLQVTILVLLLNYIYKRVVTNEYLKYSFLIPIFISLFFIEGFYFSKDYLLGYLLLATGYHIGPFINALIVLSLLLSSVKKPIKLLLVFSVVLFAAFSDKLFLPMLIAPLILTLVVSVKKTNKKETILLISVLVVGSVIGLFFQNYLNENKYFNFTNPHRIYDASNALPSFFMFVEQMCNYLTTSGARSFQIGFTFFSIIYCSWLFFKNKLQSEPRLKFFILFYLLFTLCVFLAPILNGNYTGKDTIRYNIYPFFLAAIPFAFLFASLLKNRINLNAKKVIMIIFPLVLMIGLLVKFNPNGLANYFNYYPESVCEIDSVAKKYNLHKGISDYWHARKTTVLSKQGVTLLSVHDNACLREFSNNIDWFYEGEFDFVIAGALTHETIAKLFVVRDSIITKDCTILLVDKFMYSRGKYAPEKCFVK